MDDNLVEKVKEAEQKRLAFLATWLDLTQNNKGLPCPLKVTLCLEGYCFECQIFLDHLEHLK